MCTNPALKAILDNLSQKFDIDKESIISSGKKNDIGKIRVSLKSFYFNVVFPIIVMLLPMIHSQYLHDLDELESRKSFIELEQYQEEHLRIEMKQNTQNEMILDYLQQILDHLSNQEESEQFSDESDYIPHQTQPIDELSDSDNEPFVEV